ncbi:MAG: hypothetical protein JXR81_04120 [Candidatus Goldbacteria bacterium]|nr:hypothetical protein [Candidatus Goldiibacteriota bacterium]
MRLKTGVIAGIVLLIYSYAFAYDYMAGGGRGSYNSSDSSNAVTLSKMWETSISPPGVNISSPVIYKK